MITIKQEDMYELMAIESTLDTLLQGGLFRDYFPEIADKMLDQKSEAEQAIAQAYIDSKLDNH